MSSTGSIPGQKAAGRLAPTRLIGIGLLVLVLILLVLKPPFVIVSLRHLNGGGGSPAASPGVTFIDSIWDAKVVPAIVNNAIEADTLLAAIHQNAEEAGQKYGRREATNPFNYLIKGAGTITDVRTQSRAGTALLQLGGAAAQTLVLQVGPVVTGTAIRDASGVVNFNQFTNQIDFADVSKEMNSLARKSAFGETDPTTLKDKKVRFWGAFTDHPGSEVKVTPVKIEVIP
jgi:predicted lipoprotein